MTNEKNNIDEFLVAIDNLLNSKYILVDRRISDVLLSIADTIPVYNLIAECMINFDFRQEWEMATKGRIIKFPETDDKKISFIFCLLNNIDDGNLDITKVLERFFSYNSEVSPYELFCNQVIVEFKKLILNNLNLNDNSHPENNINHSESNESEPVNFELLTSLLSELSNQISHEKRLKKCFMQKQDIVAVVSTFEQAAREEKVEYFYAFMVTIKTALGKNRAYKSKVNKILGLANDLILRG